MPLTKHMNPFLKLNDDTGFSNTGYASGPPDHKTVSKDLQGGENSPNENKKHFSKQETENLQAWKAEHEAELLEEKRRECFHRVSESSWHYFLAWSCEEFCQDLVILLKEDKDFRYQFVKRTRLKRRGNR